MKKANVQIGRQYKCKVSGNIVAVQITGELPGGGWEAKNLKTGKTIRIRSAQRLRGAVPKVDGAKPKPKRRAATRAKTPAKASKDAKSAAKRDTGERGATSGKTGGKPKARKTSLLDAAAHILSLGSALPMRCNAIVKLAIDRNLWTPGKGKTPASTLYAAIHREIKAKGKDARFRKAERGKFELNR